MERIKGKAKIERTEGMLWIGVPIDFILASVKGTVFTQEDLREILAKAIEKGNK